MSRQILDPGDVKALEWRRDGACSDDEDLFLGPVFYVHDQGEAQEQGLADALQRARETCASCPVNAECLEWALTKPEEYGVWGGTTPRQRGALRKAAKEARKRAE